MNILVRVCMNLNFCYRANFLSKLSMNLKIHAYNLETVIVRCNGATIFVIALVN